MVDELGDETERDLYKPVLQMNPRQWVEYMQAKLAEMRTRGAA
jgi:hypothetical protein